MPRTNLDGKSIRRVLSWLTNTDLTDGDLAEALGVSPTYYKRHKFDDCYPTFEHLNTLAAYFNLSACALQIGFGYRDVSEVVLLDPDGMHQYLEAGGSNHLGALRTSHKHDPAPYNPARPLSEISRRDPRHAETENHLRDQLQSDNNFTDSCVGPPQNPKINPQALSKIPNQVPHLPAP